MEELLNKKLTLKCLGDEAKKVYLNSGKLYGEHYIKGCGEEVEIIMSKDIFPGEDRDPWGEEYLCFYWVCPKCKMLHKLEEGIISREEKAKIFESFDCNIEKDLYNFHLFSKIERELSIQLQKTKDCKEYCMLNISKTFLNPKNAVNFSSSIESTEKILKKQL